MMNLATTSMYVAAIQDSIGQIGLGPYPIPNDGQDIFEAMDRKVQEIADGGEWYHEDDDDNDDTGLLNSHHDYNWRFFQPLRFVGPPRTRNYAVSETHASSFPGDATFFLPRVNKHKQFYDGFRIR